MSSQNTKILYTYLFRRSFVHTDLTLLEEKFNLYTYHFDPRQKIMLPLALMKQFFFLLFNFGKYDYYVSFFAGYHSALPALFAKWAGKKAYIFLGGTDCFKYPSFHYGNFTKTWYGMFTCFSARQCSLLIPVSRNLIQSTSMYYDQDSQQQGIYHWCKGIQTPYEVIPLEYKPALFYRREVARKEKSFISVAFGIEGTSFIRKGIDKIVMLANQLPHHEFTIIGTDPNNFPVNIPDNLKLLPPVPYEQLPNHYSEHQFYLQLSIAEGFPSAVCEAMLCECIPIGSEVAAIPEIISTHGFLVPERKDEVIIATIHKAIAYVDKEGMGKSAREYIVSNFGPGRRINALLELFD